ncbi:transcriptional regulator NrdR [uncultured Mediterranean phage uvMED]|jgi:transcriptional regulator NrdR family protein|nr:transcriptional regulator NrdR [uncultured Mediterranean phage uvMED]BAQ89995.1 putative transcriptional regulator [uncultured Mediterranean phage uvMED]BAQ90044.1 transcriptional regulator NrdR [uncultured Mediterranean phage uvMED]
MRCLECGKGSRVVDSKKTLERITRRRECVQCGHRWNTIEYREGVRPKAEPIKPKAEPRAPQVRERRRSHEELFDMREGYDSDIDDILNDLGY